MSAPTGERHHCARRSGMTADKVREIRELVAAGAQQKSLAARFNVSPVAINKIVRRVIWKHVN